MKIIENCWDEIGASDCNFGAHIFENSTARIYVHDGLDVGLEMGNLFQHVNDDGFAGPCVLLFYGVKKFDLSVNEYKKQNGHTEWKDPVLSHYEGHATEGTKTYHLAGDLHGFLTYVTIEIEAQKFELHILEKDEPAWQS